ncbi:hypothetical protein M413DRAFT_59704 [Hebeloma cylindrosporum]|uniref:Protein N-terminal glutamine amidohydrolase n=1 Tax=Hebeloma cylindrosporum TaxID=76867 RepID=A0A0C2Z8F3_HEBCY|nr:hypothetical protein M413DRAFT_59704 [Hebeloma cylindrosporum h7]
MNPPCLPHGSVYTSCYCEENIYLLCQTFLDDQTLKDSWEIFGVFISNEHKTKAARIERGPIVWDYHVILVLRQRTPNATNQRLGSSEPRGWVYDFDTLLPTPCPWQGELSPMDIACFHKFRVISGEDFIQNFASDRSHMLIDVGVHDAFEGEIEQRNSIYSSPPPAYAPICGPSALERSITNNLMENFVSMVDKGVECRYGMVLDRDEVDSFFREE